MGQNSGEAVSFKEILSFIARETGLMFASNRVASAEAGITRAMERVNVTSTSLYLELLGQGGLPMDDLLAELTIGETYFFRDPKQFDFLREEVIPELSAKSHAKRAIRAWSAGCATGEEAYTLAIMLKEERRGMNDDVVGTDISRARLAVARRGRYRKWSLRSLRKEQIDLYFRSRGDTYSINPEHQKRVEFSYLNLAEDSYPSLASPVWGMDIIMCRNVLIYFDKETVTRVARRLVDSLSENGWLLIGPSDPVLSDYIECHVVQTKAGLVYRKSTEGRKVFIPYTPTAYPPSNLSNTSANPATPPPPNLTAHSIPLSNIAVRIVPPATTSIPHSQSGSPYSITPPPLPSSTLPPSSLSPSLTSALERRDFSAVAEVAQKQMESGDTSESTAVAYVRALANLGRLSEAGRSCAAALEIHKNSLELTYLHSILLIQAKMYNEAALAARRALYFDRGFIVAHLALATALSKSGEPEKALKSLSNVENLLGKMDQHEVVFASDGETAGHLLAMARVQRTLLSNEVSSLN